MMTLINAKTLSERYSIPLGTVYYYISREMIPHYLVRGRQKFNPVEIEEWIKQGKSTNGNQKVWRSL